MSTIRPPISVEELRMAVARALFRVNEWAPAHVTAAAWGRGPVNTDAGEALNALREAARLVAVDDECGFVTFHDDASRTADAVDPASTASGVVVHPSSVSSDTATSSIRAALSRPTAGEREQKHEG